MIYTCTISPSIDYTVYLPKFETGGLNRTEEVYYYPGGKGINVSRVLQRLGVRNTALGFAGGFTGKYITEYLSNENIITDFIDTKEITRINVKLKSEDETEINGPGPYVDMSKLVQLLSKVKTLAKGDSFVLAGSLPNSIPDHFYERLSQICDEQGIHLIVDTSGPQLQEIIKYKPFLIKPNQEELAELFNTTMDSQADVVKYAKKLVEKGIQNVIVSLGGNGAIYVTKEVAYKAAAPKGKVINTVGAGDSLVAGYLAAYTEGRTAEDAFRLSVACGSATAFSSDLCEKAAVEKLLPEITIKKI